MVVGKGGGSTWQSAALSRAAGSPASRGGVSTVHLQNVEEKEPSGKMGLRLFERSINCCRPRFLVDGEFPESFSTVPSGQYFASIMIIVGMSVIATVVVLQYHHHDPNGGTMPKWVSCVSLKLSSSPPSLCPTWRPPRLLGFPSVSVSHRRCSVCRSRCSRLQPQHLFKALWMRWDDSRFDSLRSLGCCFVPQMCLQAEVVFL